MGEVQRARKELEEREKREREERKERERKEREAGEQKDIGLDEEFVLEGEDGRNGGREGDGVREEGKEKGRDGSLENKPKLFNKPLLKPNLTSKPVEDNRASLTIDKPATFTAGPKPDPKPDSLFPTNPTESLNPPKARPTNTEPVLVDNTLNNSRTGPIPQPTIPDDSRPQNNSGQATLTAPATKEPAPKLPGSNAIRLPGGPKPPVMVAPKPGIGSGIKLPGNNPSLPNASPEVGNQKGVNQPINTQMAPISKPTVVEDKKVNRPVITSTKNRDDDDDFAIPDF